MSEFGAYDAALWYVPWKEYVNKPDFWKNYSVQDLAPPGQPQYYADAINRQSQQYVSVQRKVMSAVIEGGHTPTLTPEEQMITIGKATDYVDKITADEYRDRADKFWTKDPGIQTGIGGETLPDRTEPVPTTTTDPSTIYNYYTTNNYYQQASTPASASSGPGQSDSFSWLFPLMLMMMLTQNMQQQQPQQVVVRDSW